MQVSAETKGHPLKYTFKPGVVKGVYTFEAVVPAWPGFLTSTSPMTVSIRLK